MSRRAIISAAAVVAMVGPAWAGATTAHQARAHSVKLTERLFQYSSTGSPPASGTNSYAGTSDGHIGATSVHGTVRGTNAYPGGSTFTGKNTIFDPAGSIRISFKASLGAGGDVSASGKFTGGTGRYRGARGTFTFTATPQGGSTYLRILKGTISYR